MSQPKNPKRLESVPLVTVVMPAYNAGKFIREAIESILNQDFKRFELIVIDDCSRDNTYRIAKEYEKDLRVRVYRNGQRLGDAKTRNRILARARGKYIAPHDADDIMLQGRLKYQCDFLEQHPAIGVVFGKGIVVNEKLTKILFPIVPANNDQTHVNRSRMIGKLPLAFNHGTALIRKKHVLRAGKYESSLPLGVDARLMRRIFRLTPFYFLNKFCFVYRRQMQSICRSRLRESLDSMRKIFSLPEKKRGAVLTFLINGKWIRIRAQSPALAKTLRWRLNFYAWLAHRRKRRKNEKIIDFRPKDHMEWGHLSDQDRFLEGFLRPFAATLLRSGKVIVDAGLVSCHDGGVLIFAEKKNRDEAMLSFLNRDFFYHSSGNPILYQRHRKFYGQSFVDPLTISTPAVSINARADSWGQFWNPILGKYCLNVCFYRTYLIGKQCQISKVLFIQNVAEARVARTRKISFTEAYSLYARARGGPGAVETLKTDCIVKKMLRQTQSFLIKGPQEKLKQAVSKFNPCR